MFENIGLRLKSKTLQMDVDTSFGITNVFNIIEQHKDEKTRNVIIRYESNNSPIICTNRILSSLLQKYILKNNLGVYRNSNIIEISPRSYTYMNNTSVFHIIGLMYFLDGYFNNKIQMYYAPTQYGRLNSIYNFDLLNIVLMLNPNTYQFFEKPIMNTITKSHFLNYGITFPETTLNPNGKVLNLEQFQNKPINDDLIDQLKKYVTEIIKYNRKHEIK